MKAYPFDVVDFGVGQPIYGDFSSLCPLIGALVDGALWLTDIGNLILSSLWDI